ncbi:ISAs1 family transposase [Candidatus Albibeggiatoa sp. nov. BB20]|uniref:ISAs1 family transposase n=1 Tax=Candidatus Albibeggiatoa sp. nov. BB20 TaxID=3162723 RepID=UPI003365A363
MKNGQLEQHPHWTNLKSIVALTAERELKGKVSKETCYFITSLDATNPQYLGHIIRAHWGIENNLHWVLDYAFTEDAQRL